MFGATGDEKSDVEKNQKTIWQKLRITNDIQFLTALKTVYGARRTSWTNINVFACRYLWADGSSRNLTWILTRKKMKSDLAFFEKKKLTVMKSNDGKYENKRFKSSRSRGGGPPILSYLPYRDLRSNLKTQLMYHTFKQHSER